MPNSFIPYKDTVELEAFVSYQDSSKRPLVILCHAWGGRDNYICRKAQEVSDWGYVGFALDMYGLGVLGKSYEENASLKRPFILDRELLQKRVLKGFETACNLPNVDLNRIAVIGFGFGALCTLDLARSGADIKGAVSIYGHFDPPPPALIKPIKARILVLHGYDDPIAPQSDFKYFTQEMREAMVDWRAYFYGNTLHAFTTPSAQDPAAGLLYNPTSAKRAWAAVKNFLEEIFV